MITIQHSTKDEYGLLFFQKDFPVIEKASKLLIEAFAVLDNAHKLEPKDKFVDNMKQLEDFLAPSEKIAVELDALSDEMQNIVLAEGSLFHKLLDNVHPCAIHIVQTVRELRGKVKNIIETDESSNMFVKHIRMFFDSHLPSWKDSIKMFLETYPKLRDAILVQQ